MRSLRVGVDYLTFALQPWQSTARKNILPFSWKFKAFQLHENHGFHYLSHKGKIKTKKPPKGKHTKKNTFGFTKHRFVYEEKNAKEAKTDNIVPPKTLVDVGFKIDTHCLTMKIINDPETSWTHSDFRLLKSVFDESIANPCLILDNFPEKFHRELERFKAYQSGLFDLELDLETIQNISISRLERKLDPSTLDTNYFIKLTTINRLKLLKSILDRNPDLSYPRNLSFLNNKHGVVKKEIGRLIPLLLQYSIDFDQKFFNYAPELKDDVLKPLLNLFDLRLCDFSFRLIDYLYIDNKSHIDILRAIKSVILRDFTQLSPEQIIWCLETQADLSNDQEIFALINLLKLRFKINPSTSYLDGLINSSYVQIPDSLNIFEYSEDLISFKQDYILSSFKEFTTEAILDLLSTKVTFSKHEKKERAQKLYNKLQSLFFINGSNTEVLDVVIRNYLAFSTVDSKTPQSSQGSNSIAATKELAILEKTEEDTVKKIPAFSSSKSSTKTESANNAKVSVKNQNLNLQQFIGELIILRDVFLKIPFSQTTSEHIKEVLSKEINNIYSEESSLYISSDNVLKFIRLHKRLDRLFEENGGNCSVLDNLIPSEIQSFDTELKREYFQIPESLPVHTFNEELLILRKLLNKQFSESSPEEIDELIESKVDGVFKRKHSLGDINIDNVSVFIELRQVLAKLFSINGGNTEVLDTVISSTKAFEQFENRIKSKSLPYKQIPESFHLEEYQDELSQLQKDFDGSFKNVLSGNLLDEIKNKVRVCSSTNEKHAWNKLYRNLVLLFQHNNSDTSILDIVLINGDSFANFEKRKQNKLSNTHKNEENELKHEIKHEKDQAEVNEGDSFDKALLKGIYIDSGSVKASIKETEPADFSQFENRSHTNDESEFVMKDAVSIALNDGCGSSGDFISRGTKLSNSNAKKQDTINTQSIASYLRKAKRSKEIQKESRYREAEAYEWSRGGSSGRIEPKHLFNFKREKPNTLLFPKSNVKVNEKTEYILLSIDGQTIPTRAELIGNTPQEDAFLVIQKFDKKDLSKLMKHFKKLQNENWKVIGSKNNVTFDGGDQKYLILSKTESDSNRQSVIYNRVKSLLATIGSIFLTLILFNLVITDKDVRPLEETDSKQELSLDLKDQRKIEEGKRSNEKTGWFWK